MPFTGIPYQVKKGDSLWSISEEQLGSARYWPSLYAFNCQPEVIAAGAKKISDPDRILAGSTLMLPIIKFPPESVIGNPSKKSKSQDQNINFPPELVTARPVAKPATSTKTIEFPPELVVGRPKSGGRSSDHDSKTKPKEPKSIKPLIPDAQVPLTYAYKLNSTKIVVDGGTFIARVYYTGKIAVKSRNSLPLTYILNKGLQASAKATTSSTILDQISVTKVDFDPATKDISISNKLILASKYKNHPKTAIGLAIPSTSIMPVLKAEIIYPELKGEIGDDSFLALNFKIVVEIEQKPKPPQFRFSPIPVRVPWSNAKPIQIRNMHPTVRPLHQHRPVHQIQIDPSTLAKATLLTIGFIAIVWVSGGSGSILTPEYTAGMTLILGVSAL